MDTVEIQKMNTVERLQAMEMLWDALLHEEVEVQSPGWCARLVCQAGVTFSDIQGQTRMALVYDRCRISATVSYFFHFVPGFG